MLNKYDLNSLIDLGLTNTEQKDIFNDRIMIPIHDLYGNPIGFGGRIYQTKDSSKYINTKKTKLFDKGNILYNYHRAHTKLNKEETIIIMEGYFDVIRASTIGINNCVAPMGTSLTKNHIQILKKITNHVILCFDGDEAGKMATIHALPLLEEAKLETKIIRLEEKDPDEFIIKRGKEAFYDKVKNPMNTIDFKMSILSNQRNLNDTKETSIYIDQIIHELLKEKDSILVELTLKKLATRFNMEYKTLNSRYLEYQTKKEIKVPIINQKNTKGENQYGQAVNNLLYYMTKSQSVIEKAKKNVVMILDDKKRRLFNEMIYYSNKYGSITIADFITYLTTETNVADTFEHIFALNLKEKYTEEEIDDYIKCINYYYKKNIIDQLKIDLQKETDPMKQASIINEMMKIRGVKIND